MEEIMKNIKQFIIILFVSVLLGLSLGGYLGVVGAEPSFDRMEFSIIIIMLSAVLSIPVHILIHEAGHGIAGLLTGFRLVSYRIFDFQIQRKESKWVKRKVHIPGTAGQCVMEPKGNWQESNFFFYLLGGGLLNLIVSFILLYISLELKMGKFWEIFLGMAIMGVFLGLSNLFPLVLSGVATDGKNISILRSSTRGKQAIWSQLKIAALLSDGYIYKNLPEEYFFDFTGFYNENFLTRQMGILTASYWTSKGQVLRGEKVLAELDYANSMQGLEAMVYSLTKLEILRAKEDWILYKEIYESVKDLIKPLKNTEDGKYAKYIYEKYCLEDHSLAEKTWQEFLQKAETSAYKGVMETMVEEEKERQAS